MNSETIIWRQPPPYSRDELLQRLRQILAGRVEQAFLFGSYALGTAHAHSDVDLLIIADSQRHPTERFKDFLDLYKDYPAIDLVIYSPHEWKALQVSPNTLLLGIQDHCIALF